MDLVSMDPIEPNSEAADAGEYLQARGPCELELDVRKSAPASETEHQLGYYEFPECVWL